MESIKVRNMPKTIDQSLADIIRAHDGGEHGARFERIVKGRLIAAYFQGTAYLEKANRKAYEEGFRDGFKRGTEGDVKTEKK